LFADPVAELVRGREFKMLIGGEPVDAVDGSEFRTLDPSTGQPLIRVPQGGPEDVGRAVEAAAKAQPEWEQAGIEARCEFFEILAREVDRESNRLAMLDAIDGGMPFSAMLGDLAETVENLRQWPRLARWHGGRTIPIDSGGLHYTSYRPYGVVGKIVPFNHPALFATTKILGALIAGNTVVLKPAEQTPLSALAFGDICRGVLPRGVVNIVTGDARAGDALVVHPSVKRLSFTGGGSAAMKIQQRAATAGIKTVTLELGGKNPMIVFPDIDPDAAAAGAIKGMNITVCAGQSCGSNSRVFVHRDIYDEFSARTAERLEDLRIGPAYVEDTDVGPLVSAEHRDRVRGYVELGRREGARLVCGGDAPPAAVPSGGFYLKPTLFADVDAGMTVAKEEIFGPVISVFPWDDYEQVIAAANDTDFGLTASVWTNDLSAAHATAERLNAGYVWINESSVHYWGTPFGGWGSSGIGREECIEEYESYLELKVVHTRLGRPDALLRSERRGSPHLPEPAQAVARPTEGQSPA
jgi:betaine-aldehyde dehydrogenase